MNKRLAFVALAGSLAGVGVAAPAHAATTLDVNYLASLGGTPITIGNAVSPQYAFELGTFFNGANSYILRANGDAKVAFPDNGVPQTPGSFVYTAVDPTAVSPGFSNVGDFQLFFTIGTTAYTGTATVVDAGHRISAISFSPAVVPVPEPTTWAMMGLGLGTIGFGMRRRSHGRNLLPA